MAKKQESTVWKGLGLAALGAAVGGVAALLASPKSGKQNRAVAAKEVKKVAKAVSKKATAAGKAAKAAPKKKAAK